MADRTVSVSLQLKIAGFTSALRTAQNQASKFADDVTTKARKNKGAVDDLARGFGGIGLAAGVGVGLAIKKFADFDKAMSNVKAATHETAGNMALLREAALDAGAKTAFSATEAAGAIENLSKAGVSTNDILRGGLNGALALAAAGEIDVGDAAETAATAMTQFHLAGKDIPHIADLLAAGAGKAQGEVSDMSMALKQSGLVASQFGLSIEDTTGTLAAFASAGLIGSDAGTSFKTMLLQLANPSAKAADTMRSLGINAYDAQGAFVGIAPLAEQLRTHLSKLSQEQRDAALATIFGSDAIRAANVLYQQGGKGIDDWATKVNDAGYAAETAAAKQDNLRGDIEKLGGSLETALIKGGSGANDALRALVSTADDAVTGFTKLPPAVQQVAVGLASVASIGGLGAAGILKAAAAAGELRKAWTALGSTARKLTISMGLIGIALSAAVAIYGAFKKSNEEAEAKVDDVRSTLDQATGAITKNTRAWAANQLATSGQAQAAKDLGLSLPTVTDAVLGNKDAIDQVTKSLWDIQVAETDEQGVQSDHAKSAAKLSNELFGLNGTLTEAQRTQKLTTEASKENVDAQKQIVTVMPQVKDTVKAAKEAIDGYIDSLLKMPGITLSVRDAQRGLQSAIDEADKSIKENGKTLDIHTEKGRNNQAALDEIADRTNKLTEVYVKNGYSQKAMNDNVKEGRAAFVDFAMKLKMPRAQAEALAKQLIAIPDKKKVTLETEAAKAGLTVKDYKAKLDQIAKEKHETKLTANITDLNHKITEARRELKDPDITKERKAELNADISKLLRKKAEAQAAIDALHGKNVPITVTYTVAGAARTTPSNVIASAGRSATGGMVPGSSPSPTADNIPIMATAGEFVEPVASVRYYGPQMMEDIRTRRFPKPDGYADGGRVGTQYASGGAVDATRYQPVNTGLTVVAAAPSRTARRAGPARVEMTITNWDKGTGHLRMLARDEIDAAGEFAATTGRMG